MVESRAPGPAVGADDKRPFNRYLFNMVLCRRGGTGRDWRLRSRALLIVGIVPLTLVACSSAPSSTPATGTWTAAATAKALRSCEQSGGTSSECSCALPYLKEYSYLSAGTDQQPVIMQAATNGCDSQVAATPTTEGGRKVVPVDPIVPASATLDWAGFVIRPDSCQVATPSQVQVSGSGTVPPLTPGGGKVAGHIEAWAVYQDGTVAYGRPAPIPDVAGTYNWSVKIPVAAGSQIERCQVQGIDPYYPYTNPQAVYW